MNSETSSPNPPDVAGKNLRLKIIGVGTAGTVMADQMSRAEFAAAGFVYLNTDNSGPGGPTKSILLENKTLRGLGTGGDPERGRQLAEEQFEKIQSVCAETDVVLLLSGLGGGTGSGALPVVARAARESGALVLAFVTLPFECEGARRQQQAQAALDQLQLTCDGVICLPNQKAVPMLDVNASCLDTFRATARLLGEGMRCAWRLLVHRGLIELHFEELCAVLRERHGESCFATLEATGPTRAWDLIEKIPAHPLLDGGQALTGAASVLVSIFGGPSLSLAEINQVMQDVTARCPQARVIMGAAIDEQFGERLAVTLIATRPPRIAPVKVAPAAAFAPPPAADAESAATAEEFGSELLHPTKAERPTSRLTVPAPALTLTQRDEIISKQPVLKSGRSRKSGAGPRMRQITLPLDIVNKGRFDKSEPTIHKGEDLDLPTYVRRGVALN